MRHLHRAKHESLPNYKYIYASIAAELAIKEVLCRRHPDLQKLLLEMPSPPLEKLYGPILEHYLGHNSGFKNKLNEGQAKRNNLIHQPGSLQISLQQANEYVAVVEKAIFHLLSIRYPKDKLIKRAKGQADANTPSSSSLSTRKK